MTFRLRSPQDKHPARKQYARMERCRRQFFFFIETYRKVPRILLINCMCYIHIMPSSTNLSFSPINKRKKGKRDWFHFSYFPYFPCLDLPDFDVSGEILSDHSMKTSF